MILDDEITLEIGPSEREFFNAYLEAIYFTDCKDAGEDLEPSFYRESLIDCLAFFSRINCYLSGENIEQAGHDFWLTRNGHGTGFWDRPEVYGGPCAERFTKYAESFGEVYPVFEGWCPHFEE